MTVTVPVGGVGSEDGGASPAPRTMNPRSMSTVFPSVVRRGVTTSVPVAPSFDRYRTSSWWLASNVPVTVTRCHWSPSSTTA